MSYSKNEFYLVRVRFNSTFIQHNCRCFPIKQTVLEIFCKKNVAEIVTQYYGPVNICPANAVVNGLKYF